MLNVLTAPSAGRIITFYSYKGGTGRTMMMANVAWILASQGKRVLAVDWDLEAPGLHRYFHPFLIDSELIDTDGIIDMVIDYATASVTDAPPASTDRNVLPGSPAGSEWYRAHADVTCYACSLEYEFPDGGVLDVLPAGRQSSSYSTRVNTFDWRNFYERQGGGAFLEAVKERMRESYDYILIDSRTGVSDTSGICTVQMPDDLVVCFTLNNQSIEGASGIATSVREQRRDPAFRIFPVPTRVEMAEKDKLEQRRTLARSRFALFPGTIAQGAAREEYWGAVEMPYVPYYAYEEILSTVGDRAGHTTSLLAAAERLTSYLTDGAVRRAAQLKEPERLALVARYAPHREAMPLDEMAREAERIYSTLDAHQQECARRLFTRLVRAARPNEGRDVSISAPVSDVGDLLPDTYVFVTAGVLTIDADANTGEQVLRFASPGLVENWPRLRDWINENRGFLAWQEQLRYKRAEWEPAHDNAMLLTGQALNTALEWVRKRGDEITQTDRDFIRKSARERRNRRLVRSAAVGFLLFIAGSVALGEWVSSRRERAAPLVVTAMAFHDAGRNDSAAAYFERALAFDPNQKDALLGLAEIRLAGGDPENAISLIDRTISLDSGLAGVWSLRGNAYALASQPQLAIDDYNRALSIDSSASDVRFNRALAYEESGDSVSAIADYWQLLNTGDAPTRQAATARLERLGVQTTPVEEVEPRVYFHYTAPADLRTVTAIAQALGKTFDVRGVERRTEATQGDVRSFHSADADVAETVANMVEKELAGNGYPLRLRRLRPDSTRFGNVPRGQIEVWLPALSTPVFRR